MKRHNYRICHLSKYYPPMPGGIETHVQTLARAQASLGAEVHVFCVNGFDEKGSPSTRTKTVSEMDGDVRVTRIGRFGCLSRFDLCPELPGKLCRLVSESNTLLHPHTPNPTMLTSLMALDKRIPLGIPHHSDIIKERILKYAVRPIEHYVYSQASRILTDSTQYISGSKFLRLSKNNLSDLPLCLD